MHPTLIIGNKNYSSWSLRPWLILKIFEIPFEEVQISLYQPGTKNKILMYSPSAKVPVLKHHDVTCWDSLAICEYLADHCPNLNLWPQDNARKALARSISNEMHSGFFEIRNTLPMNCRLKSKFDKISQEMHEEITRICDIWIDCRNKYRRYGDFLFGEFSIADAMYAPVVLRFTSYGIEVGDIEREYMKTILELEAIKEWIAAAAEEKEVVAEYERG